jgi:hypothetical protein
MIEEEPDHASAFAEVRKEAYEFPKFEAQRHAVDGTEVPVD